MKKYTCTSCVSTSSVIRHAKRGTSIQYLCKHWRKYFSIKTIFFDKRQILNDHLDGISFRKLAVKYDIGKSHATDICYEELRKLPNNNQFTHKYCDRFSHIFVVDGKCFTVKGYCHGYCLLWGVDYLRYDIPVFILAPSENYSSWAKYFSYFRIINRYPELLVCDDNSNIQLSARNTFPQIKIQTFYNHFKENIRRELHTRRDTAYKPFMRRIESILSDKLNSETFNHWMFCLYSDYRYDSICLSVLTNIERYKSELLSYRNIKSAPITSNLMELFNSHL